MSLAQFRDNILVGARRPSPTHEMQSVCDIVSEVWNLPVLCDCMTEDLRVCQRTCTSPSLTAMGFTVHLGNDCPPLVYAQPSGLTATWRLKYTMTLQSPPTQAYKHVSNILVSAVLNVQPFLHTSCLLSITSWAQVAVLSGYSRPTVLRALHSAVPRIVARETWTRHLYGANMLLINCLPPGRQSFSTCIVGSKATLFGLTVHTHHGTCHMQDPATRTVPTGATIFLYY